MKKTLLSLIILSAASTNLSFADHKERHNQFFGKQSAPHYKVYRKLNLTEEQKSSIKAIFRQKKDENQFDFFKNRLKQQEKRNQLIQSTQLDNQALQHLADEQATQIKQRFIKMVEAEHQVWNLLTPQQQQKAKTLQEERLKKIEKRLRKKSKKHKKQNRE